MTFILHKILTTAGQVPDPNEIGVGEIVLNITDGHLFTKNTGGSIIWLNGVSAPVSASYTISASYAANSIGGGPSATSSYAHTASIDQRSLYSYQVFISGGNVILPPGIPLSVNQYWREQTTSATTVGNAIYVYPFITPTNCGDTLILQDISLNQTNGLVGCSGSFAIYSNSGSQYLFPGTLLYSSSAIPMSESSYNITSAETYMSGGQIYWVGFHKNMGSGTFRVASTAFSGPHLLGSITSNNNHSRITSLAQFGVNWGDSGAYSPAWPTNLPEASFEQTLSPSASFVIMGRFRMLPLS